MTKDDIQRQYKEVAAKAGDVVFKLDTARQVVADLETRLNALRAERNQLQAALEKVTSDVAAAPVDVPSNQPEG